MSLLVLCFIVTVGCLILHQRYEKRYARYLTLTREVATTFDETDNHTPQTSRDTTVVVQTNASSKTTRCSNLPTIKEGCCEESPPVDIEDILTDSTNLNSTEGFVATGNGMCPSRFNCPSGSRGECQGIIQQYREQIDDDLELIEEEPESHDPQILRHIVLLILLLCSMFVVSISFFSFLLMIIGVNLSQNKLIVYHNIYSSSLQN